MTRKDYVDLAHAVRTAKASCRSDSETEAVKRVAILLADICAKSSGAFDRDRFMENCGFVAGAGERWS